MARGILYVDLNDRFARNLYYTPCPEKRVQFSLRNFNEFKEFRQSFVIFGMNHPWELILQKNRKFSPNIITSSRSADFIVSSLETTLSRTASG